MIVDPGNHWHKDDMPYEDDIPGITDPNYDEHPDDADCPGWENLTKKILDEQNDDTIPF